MYKTSEKYSFNGWDLVTFLKGRKKIIVGLIAAGLGYLLTNQADIAFWSALIGDAAFSIAEFYLKELKIEWKP